MTPTETTRAPSVTALERLVMTIRVRKDGRAHPLQIWKSGGGRYYVRDVEGDFLPGWTIAGPFLDLESAGAAMHRASLA